MKCYSISIDRLLDAVVPHEGTWIEIANLCIASSLADVVPHEGTWIEIIKDTHPRKEESSFPTRERGLKFPRLLT